MSTFSDSGHGKFDIYIYIYLLNWSFLFTQKDLVVRSTELWCPSHGGCQLFGQALGKA